MKTLTLEAIEDLQHCPRLRYWKHEHKDKGLCFTQLDLNETLELLVSAGITGCLGDLAVDGMAGAIREKFLTWAHSPGFRYPSTVGTKVYDTAQQYAHLAEGLLRGYVAYKMPRLRSRYEVELSAAWTVRLGEEGTELRLSPDAIAKREGKEYAVRFVVASRELPTAAYYHTGLALAASCELAGRPVDGVIFEIMFRGELRNGDLNSPLVRGWYNPETFQYSWTRKTLDPLTGEAVFIGKDWVKLEIPRRMASKDWIDILGQFSRGQGPFPAIYPDWEPIPFGWEDVKDWIRATSLAESKVDFIKGAKDWTTGFEKRETYCGYCPFPFVCWGTEAERLDPIREHPALLRLR